MFYEFQSRLILAGTLTTRSAIRVGVGRNLNATDTDLPVIKDVLGKPFIPGSTIKGVLRSRVETILRTLLPGRCNGACNPLLDEERCITPAEIKRIKEKSKSDDALTQSILNHSCLACQLFGSPWFASRVQVRDWQVDERYWFAQFQVRNGVAIDRDTETAVDSMLYSYEVVPAGTLFTGAIHVENGRDWQLGLLLAGLQEFEHSLALGGATSRGLGAVSFGWDEEKSGYLDPQSLWQYLADDTQRGASISDKRPAWRSAMIEELRTRRTQGEQAIDQEKNHA